MKKLKELIADEPEWPHAYKIVEIDGVEWLCGEFEVEGHLITFYGKNFDDLVREFINSYEVYERFRRMDSPS